MPVPQLYIDQRPFANAFTFCVESPIIALYSGLIELLDEDEWRVVLGHELGHIKAGHVPYRQIAEFVANLLLRLRGRTFGLAQGLGAGLFYAFFHWYRQSELTADRASLLVSQDITTVLNTEMKLGGGSRKMYAQMDKDAFLQQGRDYEEMGKDALNSFFKMGQTLNTTHPFPAVRALDIDGWAKGEEYAAILKGNYPKSSEAPSPTMEAFQGHPPGRRPDLPELQDRHPLPRLRLLPELRGGPASDLTPARAPGLGPRQVRPGNVTKAAQRRRVAGRRRSTVASSRRMKRPFFGKVPLWGEEHITPDQAFPRLVQVRALFPPDDRPP